MSQPMMYVLASGDTTGRTDAVNLQMAIDAMDGDTTRERGVLVLSGNYHIDTPLTTGSPTFAHRRSCVLSGAGIATIQYVGSTTSKYLWSAFSGAGMGAPKINNVVLDCGWKCRGVLLSQVTYSPLLDHVYIAHPREVGLDLVNCWGSAMEHVRVFAPRGVGIRTITMESHHWSHVSVSNGNVSLHANGGTNTAALQQYEFEHGRAAARSKYGGDYRESWPDPADQSVKDYQGNPVQTKEDDRGLIVVKGSCGASTWNGLLTENNYCGDYPLVAFVPYLYPPGGLVVEGWYMEENTTRLCSVLARGQAGSFCGQLEFRNVRGMDRYRASVSPLRGETFVRCEVSTTQISVANALFRGHPGQSILQLNGGTHSGHRLVDIRTYDDTMPRDHYMQLLNGAVYREQASNGLDP